MKKLLGLLAIGSMAFVSCSQEDELRTSSGATFEDFTGEIINAESRTSLGSDGSVLWSEDDAISLYRKTGWHQKYKVENGGASSTNFLYDGYSEENTPLDMNYAVYPYNVENSMQGNTMTVDLSSLATQTYTANTFENNKAVMVAKSSTKDLPFTNAFSVVNFALQGEVSADPVEKIYVTKIKIESATKSLWGTATINMSEDRPAAVFAEDDTKKSITLICTDAANLKGIELKEEVTNFYALMPATTFPAKDLTITIYATIEGEAKEYVVNMPNEVKCLRSKITKLNKKIELDSWSASTELTLENVENAEAANEALKTTAGVKIADAADANQQTPITIPAKEEAAAAKEHVIEFATMPTTPVYIAVVEGNSSSTKTVENLEVIVPVGTTSGSLNITAPGTTVTIKATDGTVIDQIVAETAENTLIIESGVTVNNLLVKGGNVEVYGTVKSIARTEDNDDGLTYIYLKEGAVVENYPTQQNIFVVDTNGKVFVDNEAQLQAALNNAVAGIKLLGDITTANQLIVKNNFVIDGDNYTLTTSANRAIQIIGGTVVINDLTVNMPEDTAEGNRGINLYNGDTNKTLDVTLNNVTVNGYKAYAVNIGGGTNNKLTINKSTLTGYAAINVHVSSVNHTIVVDGSTLNGKNHNDNYTFGTVVVDGTNAHSLTITNSIVTTENLEGVTSLYNQVVVGANCTYNVSEGIEVAVRNIMMNGLYYIGLEGAINDAKENDVIKLLGDIKVSDVEFKVAKDKKLTIDLNGFDIIGIDNTTRSFGLIVNNGELTVKNTASTPGNIILTANNNRGWNAYSSVISNNPGGNLTVESGVVIEHLGGTDMAYGIDNLTNGKGTKAITTVDGATVKSTYRAIRQFLNGIEAINELHVKSGIIEGANKSIWMQNANAKANPGKLTVEANAQLKGDVQLSASDAAVWPVEVSIAESALVNGSTVVPSKVPDYYLVEKNAGYWVVNKYTKVTTADELVAALEANENVLFMNDIKIDPANMSNAYGKTGINVKNGQTIDGGGHTLNILGAGGTWDSGINTTGGLIKNITVTGSFRGIFINHTSTYSEKVVLENVTLTGVTYTISCDQGLYQGIEATNCTFNGWTSFAKTAGEAKFVNCSFGEGNGYKYCRPYSNTEFVNCTFCPGYAVDESRATVTFTGCTFEE